MPRCGQDGELAPGTPVAGPAWDITRQMRSRADQRNAPHWERLNGCWCAPANHHAVATNNKSSRAVPSRVESSERAREKERWEREGGRLLNGGRRKEGLREAQAAGRGPNSDLIHSRLEECLPLLSRWISSPNAINLERGSTWSSLFSFF